MRKWVLSLVCLLALVGFVAGAAAWSQGGASPDDACCCKNCDNCKVDCKACCGEGCASCCGEATCADTCGGKCTLCKNCSGA